MKKIKLKLGRKCQVHEILFNGNRVPNICCIEFSKIKDVFKNTILQNKKNKVTIGRDFQ